MPTKGEKDQLSGVETTGHEWDGIKELNNPLPKWWLYVFYATIAFSVVYWVLFPAWPGINDYTKGVLGWSQRQELEQQIAQAREAQADYLQRIETASLEEIRSDPDLLNFALAGGRIAFADNCAACHGAGGGGAAASQRWPMTTGSGAARWSRSRPCSSTASGGRPIPRRSTRRCRPSDATAC